MRLTQVVLLAEEAFPRRRLATLQEWDDAIVKLNHGRIHPGCDALMKFLATSYEGQLVKLNVMGMDNVEPSKLRLKMYFASRHTSFQSGP